MNFETLKNINKKGEFRKIEKMIHHGHNYSKYQTRKQSIKL